jgi:hypothetical protein
LPKKKDIYGITFIQPNRLILSDEEGSTYVVNLDVPRKEPIVFVPTQDRGWVWRHIVHENALIRNYNYARFSNPGLDCSLDCSILEVIDLNSGSVITTLEYIEMISNLLIVDDYLYTTMDRKAIAKINLKTWGTEYLVSPGLSPRP